MGRLDREAIGEHLAALEEALAVLGDARSWTAGDLAADTRRVWIVAHGLQVAIQNVLDISAHLAAGIRPGSPEDYRSAILALGELGVTDPAFAAGIAPMAGLRNIIVHGYLRLQVDRLLEALARLEDFVTFARCVDAFLARNPGL